MTDVTRLLENPVEATTIVKKLFCYLPLNVCYEKKIWKKGKSKCEKIWKIQKKSKLNCEKIGKIWKKPQVE
jgi:hypothetical protein